jgi:hypothetical protein
MESERLASAHLTEGAAFIRPASTGFSMIGFNMSSSSGGVLKVPAES